MKNIGIILLLIIASNIQAQAQKADYHKLLDTGKVWYTVQIGEFGDIIAENISLDYDNPYNANDTIYYSVDGRIIIREDTIQKKVYSRNFSDWNEPSGPEELLYDLLMVKSKFG